MVRFPTQSSLVRAWAVVSCACVAALAIAVGGVGAQPVIQHPIEISQVSWDMASTGVVDYSEYGHLRFDFTADPNDIYFVNVMAKRGSFGPTWLVENMPILSSFYLESSTSETCESVDLLELGVVRGTSVEGDTIFYSVAIDPTPIPGPPAFSPDFFTVIDSTLYSFGEVCVEGGARPGGLGPPKAPDKPAWNGSFDPFRVAWRFGMPNGEQGVNQCGPSALANSMHWLKAQYPEQVLFEQTWNETLDKFKVFTGFHDSCGISNLGAVVGKLRFALDTTKVFVPDLVVKYEADSTRTGLGGSVTVGEKTAHRHGPSGPPKPDWLMWQLRSGEDVEIAIHWLNNAADSVRGGHMASVTGAFQIGNKMWIWTSDDHKQGSKDSTGAPPENGGLATNLKHQVTIENGGYMRLSGYKVNNRIVAVFSESLGEQPTILRPDETCGDGDSSVGVEVALSAHPNPFQRETTLRFYLTEPAAVLLRIYGVDGRLVRTLMHRETAQGWQEVTWDGREDSGSRVGSGVYMARLEASGRSDVQKLLLLRRD